jgi:hypothetical protein
LPIDLRSAATTQNEKGECLSNKSEPFSGCMILCWDSLATAHSGG